MATIRELRGRWQAIVRLKGYPPTSQSFDRKTDAKIWAAATEADMRARRWRPPDQAGHTLAHAIERYEREHLATSGDADTVRPQLRWWAAELGGYALGLLTPALIVQARDKLAREPSKKGTPRSTATVNRYLAALGSVLTAASKDWGMIPASPMPLVRRMREPQGRVRFLTHAEIKRLLEACEAGPPWLAPFVEIALATGVRLGELQRLALEDLQIDRRRILLQETKNGERRGVRLSTPALAAISAWLKVRPASQSARVFPSTGGFSKRWNEAVARAGIADFRFHDLRHTAASYLAMQGATLSEIAEFLGHKTLAMVKRYAHLSEGHVDRVVDRVGDVITKAKKRPRRSSAEP